MEIYLIALATWWTFAVVIFCSLNASGDGEIYERIGASVLWPIFAPLAAVALLWAIPFK